MAAHPSLGLAVLVASAASACSPPVSPVRPEPAPRAEAPSGPAPAPAPDPAPSASASVAAAPPASPKLASLGASGWFGAAAAAREAPVVAKEDAAKGAMWGDAVGDAFGAGGLGLSGVGEGGGGRGEGICLCGGREDELEPPPGGWASIHGEARRTSMAATGNLPAEVIGRIVFRRTGDVLLCHESGWKVDPRLAGSVTVAFTIGRAGEVTQAKATSASVPDVVARCVARAFERASFPQPESATVDVTYSLEMRPAPPRARPPARKIHPLRPSRGPASP